MEIETGIDHYGEAVMFEVDENTDADLEQAVEQARDYIRKRGLGFSGKVQEEGEEADDIRETVRTYLRRRKYDVK